MAYVPDPTDATQPTDAIIAETAQAEFRALKAYIQTLVLGASGVKAPVRQTVIAALIAASTGLPAYAVAGAGLSVNVLATNFNVIMSIANGWDINGPSNLNTQITVDTPAAWAAIAANNTSYLSYDMLTAATGTFTQSIAPYQESTVYNQAAQSVLQFAGAAGAVVFLDDFGNTWTAQGGAKVQTTQTKFPATANFALGGSGGANALNGTTDWINSISFTSLGSGSWSLRAWGYCTSLAAVNTLIDATNAGAFGAQLKVTAAGKVTFNLSSTGAANDIAAAPVAGAATILVNTWHFYELTFDALAGVYRCYVDGVQDQTVASTLKICAITHINYGGLLSNVTGWVGYIDKPELLPYCQHPAGAGYAVPAVAPSVATPGYASDYFSINEMKMWQVSGPSTVAGNNPAFTQKNRIYNMEADTNGGAVTALRIRPLNSSVIFKGTPITAGFVNNQTFAHNLGKYPLKTNLTFECVTADNGYSPGDIIDRWLTTYATDIGVSMTHNNNNTVVRPAIGSLIGQPNTTTGAGAVLTAAHWKPIITISRGWGGA